MSDKQKTWPPADLALQLIAHYPNQVILLLSVNGTIAAMPCRCFIPPLMVANDD